MFSKDLQLNLFNESKDLISSSHFQIMIRERRVQN